MVEFKKLVKHSGNSFSRLRTRTQRGGKTSSKNIKRIYKGFSYTVELRTDEEGSTHYEIYPEGHLRCLWIEVDSGNTYALVREISKHNMCLVPTPIKNFGKIMIEIVIDILREYQTHVKSLILQDEAFAYCGNDIDNQNNRFCLSYFFMLTGKESYYETLGFQPVTQLTKEITEENRENISKLRYKDIEHLFPGLEFSGKTHASTIFKYLFETDCVSMSKRLNRIWKQLGLYPTIGSEYIKTI